MKFWQSVAFAETEHLVEIAKAAEECGFHGILISDHVCYPARIDTPYPYSPDGKPSFDARTPWPEVWSCIGAMAAATTRLRLSTMVYILPLRHPVATAQAVATAAVLSDNRFDFGIGAGWMQEEFDVLGMQYRARGRRMDEMLEIMQQLWQGGMVEHHGEFYNFENLQINPVPSERVPIFVGGASDVAMGRAARHDGWVGAGNAPEEVPGILERLHILRAEAGRADAPFEALIAVTTPGDVDEMKRLEELGLTATVSYPFFLMLGRTSPIEKKRELMQQFAETVIVPVNGG